MAQSIQSESNGFSIIESQIRECYGRVVYTHKTHEKCADQRIKEQHRLKLTQIILSAITTGGLLVVFFGTPDVSKNSAALTAIISVLLFIVNTYTKDIDLGALAEKHKHTASELWDVRESYLSLLTDLKANHLSYESTTKLRDILQEKLTKIYKEAPRTTDISYKNARGGLKNKGELLFTDEEIDKFLPITLRKNAISTNKDE
jgi:hypothetical protein